MQYRKVGHSEATVSAISLGGWLTLGGALNERESLRLLHRAFEMGVTFYDLADVYAGGAAEAVVGRFLGAVPRERVRISSKVFFPTDEGGEDGGLGAHHVRASIERSLLRLGTDHLDFYFCHREDPGTPLAETIEVMDALVREGKILHWGTSCFRPRTLFEAHARARLTGATPPLVEQPPYNLLDRHIERRILPLGGALGMGLFVWSPLAGGALTGKYLDGTPAGSRAAVSGWVDRYLDASARRKIEALVALSREVGEAPGTLALAFVLRDSRVASVITGATSVDQLEANVRAASYVLPAEVERRLDAIFSAHPPPMPTRALRKLQGLFHPPGAT